MGEYNYVTPISEEDCNDISLRHGKRIKKLNPGKAKLHLNKYSIFDETIYLDVDGILLKPIEPLFEECKGFYHSQVMGTGTKNEAKYKDMVWAYPKDIWAKYDLKDDAILPFLNSSFQYFKKCPETDELFELARSNMADPIPVEELRSKWGGNQPDELYMNIALAQLGLMPLMKSRYPIYFSNKRCDPEVYLLEHHYLLGLYGDRTHTHSTVLDYYNRKLHKMCREKWGMNIPYKSQQLMKNKWMIKKGQ